MEDLLLLSIFLGFHSSAMEEVLSLRHVITKGALLKNANRVCVKQEGVRGRYNEEPHRREISDEWLSGEEYHVREKEVFLLVELRA